MTNPDDLFDVLHAIVALLDEEDEESTNKAWTLADEWASKDTRSKVNASRFL